MSLHRFWIKFKAKRSELPYSNYEGFGITAHSIDDALQIMKDRYFPNKPLPPVKSATKDINISTLSERIRAAMSEPSVRSVWYPPHVIYLTLDCKSCRMGLSVHICNGINKHHFLMCDECYAIWDSPETLIDEIGYFPEAHDNYCTCGEEKIFSENSRWATEEEIINFGWGEYIFRPDTSPKERD